MRGDWTGKRPKSIGKMQSFWGNFGMHVRAYTYIRTMGPDGLRAVSENAILNANYIRARLLPHYDLPYEGASMHEVDGILRASPRDRSTQRRWPPS